MFDILGRGYQRPFELATLRLSNMITILRQWPELIPEEEKLLTWQGGAIIFDGHAVRYRHDDPGILGIVDFETFVERAMEAAPSD
mmetsp:Transcript_24116/g.59954  ORF Transcript_24116/g.59954 Transcript_24116/m.59954 type:complete len:85 (-) Transcript_24116:816-1070(-)